MTTPDYSHELRKVVRREAFRLARDTGAGLVTRPVFQSRQEQTVTDVEPLAGARAARDLQHAARGQALDYIRQAREAGHRWDQIGRALGLDRDDMPAADAAYTYAAGPQATDAPWQPRPFTWTCRSCDQHIADQGVIAGPAHDEHGHAGTCARLAAAAAEWDTGLDADLEAER